jgi:hypothetical protein
MTVWDAAPASLRSERAWGGNLGIDIVISEVMGECRKSRAIYMRKTPWDDIDEKVIT